MDIIHSLQALLNNTATEEDVALLKRLLASGEISIGGNVNQSVIIIGSGNTVELPPAALNRLNARPMLGNLDRDLTGEEIAAGLRRLDKLLPNRAPVLLPHYKEQVGRLRPTLKTEIKALSETSRRERLEALAAINSICVEAVDVSFNGLALGEAAPDYDARSPFRGLESFRPEDSEFFFGRKALTEKLVGKIKAHSFLAVLGASGSGKSSLVMAGVIPALDSDYIIFRPGTNPVGELESVRGKSLIVVDQFEELFTLTRDESIRKEFIARLLDESTRARIILTLRSDFLGEVGAYRTLSAEIQSHLEIIPPMDMDELRRAMEGQAGVVGLRFEADLSQQILDDVVGEPGAMPLLQHALWELWNRRHGRNLRASEYRAFGGVKQAITSTAEKVYAECSKPEQDALRDIFLRLTRLDEGGEGRDTRRRVSLGDLIPSGRDAASITLLLDKLASARLIVKAVNENVTEIEVAHEALIRHWVRLRGWLNEDRDNLRLRESVSESAKEWDASKRDDSLLNHRGERLELAIIADSSSNDLFNVIEHQYLNACRDFYEREEKARNALRRRVFIGLTSGLIVSIILAGFAIVQRNEAKKQERSARSGELAALAVSEINSHSDRAFLLGIESYLLEKNSNSISALMSLMHVPLGMVGYVDTTYGDGYSLAFSPNGNLFVSAGCREFSGVDCTSPIVSLWDVSNISYIFKLVNFNSQGNLISSVAFSEDSQFLATGSWDGSVVVWDITNPSVPKEKAKIVRGNTSVYSVAFIANGKIVAVGADSDISFWDISTDKKTTLVSKIIGGNRIARIYIYPDGRTLISGDRDGNVIFFDISNIEKPHELISKDGYFSWDVVLENNHVLIALANKRNEIDLENITNPEFPKLISHLSLPYSDLRSIGLNANGTTLAIAGSNNLLALWDVSDPSMPHEIIEYDAPPGDIISLVFHPKLEIFTTGYINRTVIFWDSKKLSPPMELVDLDSPLGKMKSLAFLPGGKKITIDIDDGHIRFWDVTDQLAPYIMSELNSTKSYVNASISPSGKRMAAIDINGVVGIWDTLNILNTRELFVLQTTLYTTFDAIEISSDDNSVWLEDQNGTLMLWDISSPSNPTSRVVDINTHIESLALSYDGKKLAIGGCGKGVEAFCVAGEISVWDISDPGHPRELAKIHAHETGITSLTFSPLGDLLVSGSGDNNIIVWDANSYEQIGPIIKGHNDAIVHLTFSQDGTILSSVDYGGNVKLWDMDPSSWLNKSCLRAGRNFTRAEWNQYFQGEEYHATCPRWPIEVESKPTP